MITGPHTGITVVLALLTLSQIFVVLWSIRTLKNANGKVLRLRNRISALERFLNYNGEFDE